MDGQPSPVAPAPRCSWIHAGPALAFVAMWGMEQSMEDFYLALTLELCLSNQ